MWSGVDFLLSAWFTSAPCTRSSWATSTDPFCAAKSNGVTPSVLRLIDIGTMLEEDLGDHREALEGGLDQRSGSVMRGRPVHLDPTPMGRPLQQPPRRVRLPAVRCPPQRGFSSFPRLPTLQAPTKPSASSRVSEMLRNLSFGRAAKT